ncbi:GNAT family N-acetyltransferase [Paenibacillus sp. IB182496]|uniref:GNAT family N-acetyltransferase n=1 Tax=Paenibacillus sabuli TaxID=2772509 RepID=A0A927GRK5_9BACL|nr:GNAT family N-acetyltransferase [Paenibacillus sabuli]MBD2845356.1 GNAT family N-acetyltransferase [Paenibacillus sabuli]
MGIHLEPVSADNWYACTKLKVKPEQQPVFPAPVVYWIAESKFVDDFELRAVYWETDLVGFIVFCKHPDEEGNYWIPALMIDEKHQGKGFGKSAMHELIANMRSMKCKRIMIGHRPDNRIAGALYEALGFKKVSEAAIDGEIIRLLQLS